MLLSLLLAAALTSALQAPTGDTDLITLGGLRGVDASMRATIAEGLSPVAESLPISCRMSNGPGSSSTSKRCRSCAMA